MAIKRTDVSINGDRVTLVFGSHYRVRYGRNDAVISDGLLDSRAANGDLVFLVDPTEIDGIPVTKRRVRPATVDEIILIPASATARVLLELDEAGEIRTEPAPDGHVRDELIAEHAAKTEKVAGPVGESVLGAERRLRTIRAIAADVAAATEAAKPKTGKAYADRNQVWKCGTCKRRTRKPECAGTPEAPHEAVVAPTGKRLADRVGDQ